jgi:chemotaxis signal transduction protein/chemotaxis regulatin CheY-phosphate phosphatase CheZ
MSNLKPVNPAGFDDSADSLDEGEIVQLVGLKLGEEEYAIDVLKIQEIIRTVEITSVPRTDSFVLGVMNLRGKVIPVVDLRIRFNLDKMDFDKETRIIVVRFESEHIGFVVDEVTEVIRISKNMVEPTPPLVGSIGQEYILGICKYDDRLIILLDIDTVIAEGKKVAESDLRKRFLGQPALESKPIVNYDEVADTVEGETADSDTVEEENIYDELNGSSSADEGGDELDDIDDLIAQELEKREKETDELNKQKKEQEKKKNEKLEEEIPSFSNIASEAFSDSADEEPDAVLQDASGDEDLDGPSMDELLTIQNTTVPLDDFSDASDESIEDILREAESLGSGLYEYHEAEENLGAANEIDEPVAEPKKAKASAGRGIFIETDSLEELKHLSKRIINGDAVDLGIDIKGEIGELLKLILDTKNKVDEIDPTIIMSKDSMPVVVQSLEQVNERTEEATMNLMEAADKMTDFYSEFLSDIEDFDDLVYKKDTKGLLKSIDHIESDISIAENLGFGILHALEFQDITEQKLRKVIKSVEEVGARIGAILGIIKAKKRDTDTVIEGASQDDIDSLLAEFGLN